MHEGGALMGLEGDFLMAVMMKKCRKISHLQWKSFNRE